MSNENLESRLKFTPENITRLQNLKYSASQQSGNPNNTLNFLFEDYSGLAEMITDIKGLGVAFYDPAVSWSQDNAVDSYLKVVLDQFNLGKYSDLIGFAKTASEGYLKQVLEGVKFSGVDTSFAQKGIKFVTSPLLSSLYEKVKPEMKGKYGEEKEEWSKLKILDVYNVIHEDLSQVDVQGLMVALKLLDRVEGINTGTEREHEIEYNPKLATTDNAIKKLKDSKVTRSIFHVIANNYFDRVADYRVTKKRGSKGLPDFSLRLHTLDLRAVEQLIPDAYEAIQARYVDQNKYHLDR